MANKSIVRMPAPRSWQFTELFLLGRSALPAWSLIGLHVQLFVVVVGVLVFLIVPGT
jgi:hypothetical protein